MGINTLISTYPDFSLRPLTPGRWNSDILKTLSLGYQQPYQKHRMGLKFMRKSWEVQNILELDQMCFLKHLSHANISIMSHTLHPCKFPNLFITNTWYDSPFPLIINENASYWTSIMVPCYFNSPTKQPNVVISSLMVKKHEIKKN